MLLKKTILFLCLSLWLHDTSLAQTVFGKVVDASTNQAVEFASVGLSAMPQDSIITGVLTQSNGYFSFENLKDGDYKIAIRVIGYKEQQKSFSVTKQSAGMDLGNLTIASNAELLDEVEVVSEKAVMQLSIDKKVYNVEKDLSVSGGTGLDAIKNIPSVSIDADGSVSMRNSVVQVFIDGKQSALTLEQIPADQIDRIEVMTNPSAKYDANTSGGILNVVMKKNRKPGYNGSIKVGIGTNERYTPSVNLNLKKKKVNLSTSYNFNTERNDNKGRTERENFTNPVPIKRFEQTSLTDFHRAFHVGKVSLDYDINKRNTMSVGLSYVNGKYVTDELQNFTAFDTLENVYSVGERKNDNQNNFEHYVSSLTYKKTFPKKGRELTIDGQYSYGTSNGNYLFDTKNTLTGVAAPEIDIQQNDATGTSQLGTFQADYTTPFNDSSKLEIGIKSVIKDRLNTNETSNLSSVSNSFEYDSILSNNYAIQEIVNAAYINYSTKFKKIGMQAGLRFEQVHYSGKDLAKGSQTFGYSYPSSLSTIGNALFPAIYFSRKANENNEWQVNFSRKLNRPRYYYLLPIVFFADRYNYRIGNPALQPEFVNKAEINYNWVKPTFNFLTSLYGQITENSILYGSYPSEDDENVLVNTFFNGDNSYTLGWENSIRWTLWKKLTISTTIAPFFVAVNYVDNNGNLLQNEGFSMTSKFMVSYKLPYKFTIQTNGLYDAPKPIPQGNKTDLFFFDISLSKKIKKFTLGVTVSDVLDTKQRGTVYETPDYEQYLIRRRHSRFIRFTASWKFGTTDKNSHHGTKH